MEHIVDGNYCTVCWHVDDLKISHVDSTVVDNILQHLEEYYVKVTQMTNTQVKVHNYMGMVLDFIKKGKVRVTMPNNIQSIIETAPTEMDIFSENPSANHLFQVREDGGDISM